MLLQQGIRYAIFGKEVCPDSGREHLQGYVELERPMRRGQVQQLMGQLTMHMEPRRGTRTEAREYCQKDGDWAEIGRWRAGGQGRRSDLAGACESIKRGATEIELANDHPTVLMRYSNGCARLIAIRERKRTKRWRDVHVSVLWGETGTGKTRFVYETHGYDEVYCKCGDMGSWWDGYTGQDVLLLDDFYGWIKHGQLLRVLDGHPLQLQIKGATTYAAWTKVYITSNKPPDQWYRMGLTPELARRINVITQYPIGPAGGGANADDGGAFAECFHGK